MLGGGGGLDTLTAEIACHSFFLMVKLPSRPPLPGQLLVRLLAGSATAVLSFNLRQVCKFYGALAKLELPSTSGGELETMLDRVEQRAIEIADTFVFLTWALTCVTRISRRRAGPIHGTWHRLPRVHIRHVLIGACNSTGARGATRQDSMAIANVLWSLAKIGRAGPPNPALLRTLLGKVAAPPSSPSSASAADFNSKDVANTLWAVATMYS